MEIEELWKLVNAKAERTKAERAELSTLRLNNQKIRVALSQLTARPRLDELLEFLRQIREVLK